MYGIGIFLLFLKLEKNLRNWFGTIATIVNISKNAFYPCTISDLAKCTVTRGKKSKPAPRVYSELFNVALFGHPPANTAFFTAPSKGNVSNWLKDSIQKQKATLKIVYLRVLR